MLGALCLVAVNHRLSTEGSAPAQGRELDLGTVAVGVSNHHMLSPVGVNIHLSGAQYLKWTTLRDIGLGVSVGQRPIMINLLPRSYSKGSSDPAYCIRLLNPKPGLHNRWQLRFMRDATVQVGAFTLGISSSNTMSSAVSLPLDLVAIDTPSEGAHAYSIQVRYIGDQVEGNFGQLDIHNAGFLAVGM